MKKMLRKMMKNEEKELKFLNLRKFLILIDKKMKNKIINRVNFLLQPLIHLKLLKLLVWLKLKLLKAMQLLFLKLNWDKLMKIC